MGYTLGLCSREVERAPSSREVQLYGRAQLPARAMGKKFYYIAYFWEKKWERRQGGGRGGRADHSLLI